MKTNINVTILGCDAYEFPLATKMKLVGNQADSLGMSYLIIIFE